MDVIYRLINDYGIYIIFLAIFLEYACFPLPSEVLLPLSGAICFSIKFPLLLMILLASLFSLLGCLFCYSLGYYGMNSIKKNKEVNYSNNLYNKYGNLSVLVARLIPLVRTYISFISGAKRHKLSSYIIFSFIGIIIWNTILISLGYVFYDNIDIISSYYSKYKFILISIIIIIIIIIVTKRLVKNN